jgi:predicted O-methyltransferase YrrM
MGKFGYAIKHPSWTFDYFVREKRLAKFFEIPQSDIKQYIQESYSFWNVVENRLKESKGFHRMSLERLQILYSAIRSFKPKIMIETGVAGGSTSLAILQAMKKNGGGKLYSIDIGNVMVAPGYEIGYIVPDEFRSNWSLIIGDSTKELPKLLNRLKKVDCFFHDSDHSYNHMNFEFNTVFPYLNPKNLVLSDDTELNSSFDEFVTKNDYSSTTLYGFGIAKNFR